MKVVINTCFGGFGLSPEATLWLWKNDPKAVEAIHVDKYWPPEKRKEDEEKWKTLGYSNALSEWRQYVRTGKTSFSFLNVFTPDETHVINASDIDRHNPLLIKVIEEMGDKANGVCADLSIVEIPDGTDYVVEEYDGNEHIAESHRTWR